MKIMRLKIIFFLAIALSFSSVIYLSAQEEDEENDVEEEATQPEGIDSRYINEINLVKGELETVIVYSLTRISLNDPAVADIITADDKKILFLAKNPGTTSLFIWDEYGKRQIVIHVYAQNLDLTQARIEHLLESAGVSGVKLTINEQEGKIIVAGNLPQDKKGNFDQIIAPFGNEVINLVAVAKVEDMVQVDMQITELKATLAKELGVIWPTSLTYKETLPTLGGNSDLFEVGEFNRSEALSAKINAMAEEGKARILSQPRLVVISGQEASFLVGGEIPIRTTTTTEGGVIQQNITFRSYGINMTVTPTIIENKVDVVLSVNVSEVDTSTADSVNESVAFSTRTASTRLNLQDGQLIILAGLIKRNNSETLKKVPFLGDIPLFGALFRNRASPAELDQELVVSLRPHILREIKEIETTPAVPAEIPEAVQEQEGTDALIEEAPVTSQEAVSVPSGAPEPLAAPSEIPQEMLDYIRAVQEKIAQAVAYPKEALQYGWEGTVKIGLLILQDGTLALASVKESSGYELFDENALNTAKNMAPYAGFPTHTDLQELKITIPIVYTLKNN